MERIKRFLLEDSATAEATGTVIMIAAVGTLLAAGLVVWYTGLQTAFSTAGTKTQGMTNSMLSAFPSSPAPAP